MAPTAPVVRGAILPEYQRLALALDLDPLALMARAGIDRRHLDNPELMLPMRLVVELLEITAMSSGIEDFGLRLAESRGLPDLGPVILMLREEATLRDALRTLIALLHLHSDALYMYLEDAENPVFVVDIMVGDSTHYRQATVTSVASTVRILRWLLGENWTPESVCFTQERPSARTRYDRFFRCPIDFQHHCNAVVLHRRDLDRKLPPSAPVLRREVERYMRLAGAASGDHYAHRVTQVVAMALPTGEVSAEFVARCLGIDCRTLHRRLARTGSNYSTVLESVRKSVAAQHLLGSDRPLSDIAGLLGFSSLSAFSRWFGASFGCTARAWRATSRSARPGQRPVLNG